MKRVLAATFGLLWVVMGGFAWGAATATWSLSNKGDGVRVYTAAIVAHTDGAVAGVTTQDVYGRIVRVVSIPSGTAAPSASWDFQLVDGNTATLTGTTCNDRSATASESVIPSVGIRVAGAVGVAAQNMGSGGAASILLYVEP